MRSSGNVLIFIITFIFLTLFVICMYEWWHIYTLRGGKHGASNAKVLAEKQMSAYDESDINVEKRKQITPDRHFNYLFINHNCPV